MGMIEKLSSRRHGVDGSAPTPPAQTKYDGRDRLRAAADALQKAQACVKDLEQRLNRLNTIVSDADAAHGALQAAIAADGGVALERYGNGQAGNEPIAALIAAKENTARAARAAKAALPSVEAMLAKARAEVTRLEGVKFDAMIVYLKTRASSEHRAFVQSFNALCKSYDTLCGIAVALDATGHSEMMTSGLPLPIKVPGFNMGTGAAHGPSETVTMFHGPNETTINNATSDWIRARERLMENAEADLHDLIGQTETQ
jgi:hypothetical protein